MKDALATTGALLAVFALVILGMILELDVINKRCATGDPQVIDSRVYRCVEQKP